MLAIGRRIGRSVIVVGERRALHAAVLNEYGGKVEVVERKPRTPQPDQLLVKVDSAGLNFSDINMISGRHYLKPVLPFVPGFELAGTVHAVGKGVKRWKEGDRVFALRSKGSGAFAEECLLDQDELIFPLPYSLDMEIAASIPVSYGTAYLALQTLAATQKGNSVLIVTSRGATGIAAIDLAQNVFKMEVIAVSDSEDKLDMLRSMGVQATLNWTQTPQFSATSRKRSVFAEHGVDFAIDTVGDGQLNEALNCLKSGGHLISLGFSSGVLPTVSVLDLHRLQATVSGLWLGGRERDEVERVMETVIGLCDEKYITPVVTRSYQLKDVATAIDDLANDRTFGKTIITCRPSI